MNKLWPVIFPLVRSAVLMLAKVVLALMLVSAALWGVRYFLYPDWQKAEAAMQAAQTQLDEANAEQADVQAHLSDYRKLVAAGLVGGEPRAIWVEDLLRMAKELGLQDKTSFTLAPPQPVELSQAEAAQARVQRHVLDFQVGPVHEIEALRLIQQLQARHAQITQVAGCQFTQPMPEGLTAQCRVNFLHIDPTPVTHDNVPE